MHADLTRLDISGRVRALVGYVAGMALYSFVVVALYPAFRTSTALDKLVAQDSTAAALFGVSGKITSSGGWLNANLYANFFPLIMLLLTIGYGAACVAGQDEDGTLGLLATLPLRRRAIVWQKIEAMVVQALLLAVAVALCVLVGRSFELTISLGHVAAVSGAVLLMGLDFGLVAMAVGALTGRRGEALGVATALAGASYLLSSLAPVIGWLAPGRYASLFYWAVGRNQISSGVAPADFVVLVGVAVAAAWATLLAFERLDLH